MRYTPAIAITILAAVTAAAGAPTPAPGVGAPGPVISYFALRRHKGVGGHSRRPKRDVAAQDGAKKWVRDDTGDASDDDPDDFLDSRALAVKEAEARRDDDTGDASSNDDPNDFFDFGSRALAVKEAEVRRDDSTGDGGDEDPNDFLDLDSRALNVCPPFLNTFKTLRRDNRTRTKRPQRYTPG
ncbi:hypothetical protein B0H16DRAFT_357967 [Mycena metata]|uniref:Uncharacterized protein n=1 Tax=Mycena metata TaxID=1033252 RepID=A0AAD7HJX2_9AGAR|nr:hypothetical protein B0H16DRAFT_357967 [Mycena metata]